MNKPLVIAHRGASSEAPENTLVAMRIGIEQGCEGIEFDIHLTKDNQIVVCHDAKVDRTTNGTGAIRDMTLEELRQLDAGSWFDEKFAGEKVPTLEEVFALAPADMLLNIELKESYGGAIEPVLAELIRRHNRLDSVVVSSFFHKTLARLREIDPEIKVGALYAHDFLSHRQFAESYPIPLTSLHPGYKYIPCEDIRESVAAGFKVYVWTVNHREDMEKLAACGVSGMISDKPGFLREVVDSL
ncbi:glycerophosphoryl diester phosphodiesterase [Paenibacillus sp. J31TS4]|uniref:glycerophosphodiester phosphodiesterase n=1 Tax=Paenibacillus sp. J31TS4 TaxID=2807195 RepID=UPI001B0B0EEC|nr:glycerophosphodiester phosphodiesterase [Paenibacillus sp. J31TS4]GIP40369.1 glycerophosphoryl diester phosphodiesterase [Paenibacillus sp. J31TS4]